MWKWGASLPAPLGCTAPGAEPLAAPMCCAAPGARVEAEWVPGRWCAGRVVEVSIEGLLTIRYEDGYMQRGVTAARVRATEEAAAAAEPAGVGEVAAYADRCRCVPAGAAAGSDWEFMMPGGGCQRGARDALLAAEAQELQRCGPALVEEAVASDDWWRLQAAMQTVVSSGLGGKFASKLQSAMRTHKRQHEAAAIPAASAAGPAPLALEEARLESALGAYNQRQEVVRELRQAADARSAMRLRAAIAEASTCRVRDPELRRAQEALWALERLSAAFPLPPCSLGEEKSMTEARHGAKEDISTAALAPGARIEAEWVPGRWHAGRVLALEAESRVSIVYDDGYVQQGVTADRLRCAKTSSLAANAPGLHMPMTTPNPHSGWVPLSAEVASPISQL